MPIAGSIFYLVVKILTYVFIAFIAIIVFGLVSLSMNKLFPPRFGERENKAIIKKEGMK